MNNLETFHSEDFAIWYILHDFYCKGQLLNVVYEAVLELTLL